MTLNQKQIWYISTRCVEYVSISNSAKAVMLLLLLSSLHVNLRRKKKKLQKNKAKTQQIKKLTAILYYVVCFSSHFFKILQITLIILSLIMM